MSKDMGAFAFQPERTDGKPRILPASHRDALQAFVDATYAKLDEAGEKKLALLLRACLNVSPTNCSWQQFAIAQLLFWSARGRLNRMQGGGEGEAQ